MITNIPYRYGDAGVDDTIALMKKYALKHKNNPKVKALAAKLKGHDEISTLKNVFRHIVNSITYIPDPDEAELVKSVKHTLFGKMPYGDCDDLSTALATVLLALNFRVGYVTISWKPGNPDFSHVYCYVYVPSFNFTLPLDPTKGHSGFGWELTPVNRKNIWEIK